MNSNVPFAAATATRISLECVPFFVVNNRISALTRGSFVMIFSIVPRMVPGDAEVCARVLNEKMGETQLRAHRTTAVKWFRIDEQRT